VQRVQELQLLPDIRRPSGARPPGIEHQVHEQGIEARLITRPADETLFTQLITRQNDVSEGLGKRKLASKKRIKELGGASPDRADAFVLAFWSFRPKIKVQTTLPTPEVDKLYGPKELITLLRRNPNFFNPNPAPAQTGRPTNLIL